MNTPTKLTVSRLILSLVIIFILLFPWSMINVTIPQVLVSGVTVDIRYPIAGVLFIIASLTDFLDGYLARKIIKLPILVKCWMRLLIKY